MDEKEILKEYFKKDQFVAIAGIEIEEITQEKAVVSAEIEEKHLNANGFVQGGMLYTLADFAFAVLGNYLHPVTVTQGGHIHYIKASQAKKIFAVATETVRSGRNTVCEVKITDELNQIVCICQFNGFIKEVAK